jgi:tRNA(fMet)-specific endonuclease VapC
MRYSLDTCTLSLLFKNDEAVCAKFAENKDNSQFLIPPMAYYEILRGFLSVSATKKTAKVKGMYQNSYSLLQIPENNVYEKAAEIYVELKNKGFTVGSNDIIIAAWSMLAEATLITNNIRDFENIDNLNYENWKLR